MLKQIHSFLKIIESGIKQKTDITIHLEKDIIVVRVGFRVKKEIGYRYIRGEFPSEELMNTKDDVLIDRFLKEVNEFIRDSY
jgi:hypothetical protein